MRPHVVYGLISLSILKVLSILVGIAWLESIWIANPPRPDVTFVIIIVWTHFDLFLAIGLWFPHRLPWIAVFCYDLIHIIMYLQNLWSVFTPLNLFMMLVVILILIRLLLMVMPSTRRYYKMNTQYIMNEK